MEPVPADAAVAAVPPVDAAVAVAVAVAPAHPAPAHPVRPGRARPATPRVATGTTPAPGPSPAPPTPPAAPPENPSCDEVSCVLEHYARACCERYRPADTGFKPRVAGELDKTQVRAGVEKVKPRVIACGEKFAAKGTVKLSISVTGDGVVKDVNVEDAPDPGLGDCVASALRKAQFAKSTSGASFVYPFVF